MLSRLHIRSDHSLYLLRLYPIVIDTSYYGICVSVVSVQILLLFEVSFMLFSKVAKIFK